MFKRFRILALITAVLIVGAVVLGAWQVQAQSGSSPQLAALPAAAPYSPTTYEQQTANLYQRVTQSVVNISVIVGRSGSATGTGFVIDLAGHIVTNNHVAEDASAIAVTFIDGTTREARVVGTDPDADLAVIQVDPAGLVLQPVTFADSDTVFIGQDVLAIGSPFGQSFTLTTGIVSARDRSLQNDNLFSIPGLIQTDAAINPGNSGGPLLDRNGNVIGVNTAILSENRSSSGVGFAIPSNTVRRIAPYLMQYGRFDHSWLGIRGGTLSPAQANALRLDSATTGVLVSDVISGGPAQQAGLSGTGSDVIIAANGVPIAEMYDLISYLENQTLPGDLLVLDILRNGQVVRLNVVLQPRP